MPAPSPRGGDEDARDIRAVAAGDAQAFRGLVERHGPRVHDLARRLLRDAHLAEDVTQQAFANAWRALPRFDLTRPFRHWILRITTNLCRNVHAARRIRPEVTGVRGADDEPLDPADPHPAAPGGDDEEERAGTAGGRAAHVRAAIEALPERYRLPVVLHHLHGLPLEEVAEITGIPVATVKTHLFRARAALRDLLVPPETSRPPGGTAGGGPPVGSPTSSSPPPLRLPQALASLRIAQGLRLLLDSREAERLLDAFLDRALELEGFYPFPAALAARIVEDAVGAPRLRAGQLVVRVAAAMVLAIGAWWALPPTARALPEWTQAEASLPSDALPSERALAAAPAVPAPAAPWVLVGALGLVVGGVVLARRWGTGLPPAEAGGAA